MDFYNGGYVVVSTSKLQLLIPFLKASLPGFEHPTSAVHNVIGYKCPFRFPSAVSLEARAFARLLSYLFVTNICLFESFKIYHLNNSSYILYMEIYTTIHTVVCYYLLKVPEQLHWYKSVSRYATL